MNVKIEKLNDNQIRCTLTRADLADRELKLSELVCGTEKAKSLFQDMMQQASSQFGFETEDMPLMIEAVPASSDSIVLIITKVDDPEELEHKFANVGHKKNLDFDKLEGADEILDLINKVKDAVVESAKQISDTQEPGKMPKVRLFSFATLDSVILSSHLLKGLYDGANTLYKDASNGIYVLALTQSELTPTEFHKICNMLSEYGCLEKAPSSVLAYLEEHCEVIIAENALQELSNI